MSNALKEKIGLKLEEFTFKIEASKVRELALAIGDLKEEYLNGEKLPPTFPTVIEFWGGGFNSSNLLGLDTKKVLHGEMEYEYLKEMKVGDEISVTSVVEDAYTKAAMNFVIIKKEFVNQNGEKVLIARSTIIERH